MSDLARQRDEANDRARAAAAEDAPVAVVVWCATCGGKGDALGEVRRSSAGLVFDARLVGAVTFQPGHREHLLKHFDDLGAGRLPIPVAAGRSVILLEDPHDPGRDQPEVECPRCGRAALSRGDLVAAAARQTSIKRPTKVLVFDT